MRWTLTKSLALYLLLPLVGALAALSAFALYLQETRQDLEFVDVAGRQRMLAVQLGGRAERIWSGRDEEREALRAENEQFEASLATLREGGTIRGEHLAAAPDAIRPTLDRVESTWAVLKPALATLVEAPRGTAEFDNAYRRTTSQAALLTSRCQDVVEAYAEHRRELQTRALVIIIIAAALLLLGGGLALWKTSRSLVRPLQDLSTIARRAARNKSIKEAKAGGVDELVSLTEGVMKLVTTLGTRTADLMLQQNLARAVVESASAGLLIVDADLRAVRGNDRFFEIIERSAQEALGHSLRSILPSKRLELLAVNALVAKRTQSMLWFEDHDEKGSGRGRVFRATCAPMRLPSLAVENDDDDDSDLEEEEPQEQLVFLLEDLSEQIRLQDATRAANARFEEVIENTSDAVVIVDSEGKVSYFNGAAERLFGHRRQDVAGLAHSALVPATDREVVDDMTQRYLSSEAPWLVGTPRRGHVVRRDGTRLDVEWTMNAYRQAGKPAIIAVYHDITARLETERELRLRAAALDAAAESIVITDRTGRIQFVNRAFTRLNKFEAREVVGKSPRVLRSRFTNAGIYEEMWATILQGRVWRGRAVNQRKDGTTYDAALYIAPVVLEGDEPTHFVGIQHEEGGFDVLTGEMPSVVEAPPSGDFIVPRVARPPSDEVRPPDGEPWGPSEPEVPDLVDPDTQRDEPSFPG